MTELQEKEFELLRLFVGLCEQLKLRYYLVCGSALGAVKYRGFIPWDDDVDVALPREDYEMFLSKAPDLVPEGIFLQNYRTDPEYPGLGSKLRNSRTTFIEKEAMKIPMNHGIFIDIFPLDGYPEPIREQRRFERQKWFWYRRRYTALIPVLHRDPGLTLRSIARQTFGVYTPSAKACRQTEALFARYPLSESRLWCNFANSMKKVEYMPCEIYGDGVFAAFEGLRVRIPANFDAYLRRKYGDYTLDPPKKAQTASHGYIIDTQRPYTEYLSF